MTTPRTTPRTISRANARKVDECAIDELGIPGIVLMENAAFALEKQAMWMLEGYVQPTALLFCGAGNNGGDGFALARRLENRGVKCACVLIGEESKLPPDARTNLVIARNMKIPIASEPMFGSHTLVVDALFGTGLSRPIEGDAAEAIGLINVLHEAGTKVLAVDVPSGLDADTGLPLSKVVVHADATVTFVAMKRGYVREAAKRYTGEVVVGGIGVGDSVVERFLDRQA